jgi:transposase-like protein
MENNTSTVLQRKENGCYNLATSGVKKITTEMIATEAIKQGLSFDQMNLAWKNYVQFDRVDLRSKNLDSLRTEEQKVQLMKHNSLYFEGNKRQNFSDEQIANVIKEYTFTDIKVVKLLDKYKLDAHQFYEWIRELNVSGKIGNKQVLNPSKYSKTNLKVVIRYSKKPHLFKNKSKLEVAKLERVKTVLAKYL